MFLLLAARDGHETRRQIMEAIRRNPGVNKSDLARELGTSWGTMSHHLQRLARQGVIKPFRDGRELLLFPDDVPRRALPKLAAVRGEVPSKILRLLAERERGIQELVTLVGSTRKVIRRYLEHMDEAGIVERGPGLHGKFSLRNAEVESPEGLRRITHDVA